MPTLSCSFCRHANPPGAKFCNECGSPLNLRPCPRCEAVTDAGAGICHQCGAAFDTEDAPSIVTAVTHAATTSEAESDVPDSHRDRPLPPPRDTATRPRMPLRGDADDDAPASSELTRVAEPDPSTHIPEWLAERFDAANRAGTARTRTQTESEPEAPIGAAGEDRAEAPSRSLLAEYDAHRPRRRLVPLLAIAAIAIAAGAYYAWFEAARSVPVIAPAPTAPAAAAVPAPASGAVPRAPAAAHDAATTSQPPVASPPPSSPAAATAEPLATTPPRGLRARTERSTGATTATSTQARRAASDTERSTDRPTQRERDADETRRLIERDLGRFMTRPPERSAQ